MVLIWPELQFFPTTQWSPSHWYNCLFSLVLHNHAADSGLRAMSH